MPRPSRNDEPDRWHHVMNRGLAKRTLFENEEDIRTFLARVAWRVHAGQLEVHAYCILTTHFHLLVRSPVGELSEAMRLLQNEYTRWFNRTRKRDGPLFRGRFRSKPVRTLAYRRYLVRYIDFNPVSAGLVASPALFPHGSARHYAARRGPPWLERSWIESEVARAAAVPAYSPEDYPRSFGVPITPGIAALIDRRIAHGMNGDDPLDRLIEGATEQTIEWMRWKAELADGVRVGEPVCSAEEVLRVADGTERIEPVWCTNPSRKEVDAWPLARVALLRDLCGCTLAEVGERLGMTTGQVWKKYAQHERSLRVDAAYAERIARLGSEALQTCHRDGAVQRIGEKIT